MSYIYETGRLGVRGLSRTELSGGYPDWFNDMEVCAHNGHGQFPHTLPELEAFVDSLVGNRSKVVWAVYDKVETRHIGNVSLQSLHAINRYAEFAILFGEKAYWGKGYAQEASRLLLTHGFNALNLHRIYCGTAATNQGMQKLAAALGMRQEGLRREALYLNGRYEDLVEYGILRHEFVGA